VQYSSCTHCAPCIYCLCNIAAIHTVHPVCTVSAIYLLKNRKAIRREVMGDQETVRATVDVYCVSCHDCSKYTCSYSMYQFPVSGNISLAYGTALTPWCKRRRVTTPDTCSASHERIHHKQRQLTRSSLKIPD
jgi:hypothetical protein